MENKIPIKGILLGNNGVGKTSFLKASSEMVIDDVNIADGIDYIRVDINETNLELHLYDSTRGYYLVGRSYRDIQFAIFVTTCDESTQSYDDESIYDYFRMLNEYSRSFHSVFLLNKIDLLSDEKNRIYHRIEEVKTHLESETDIKEEYQLIPISCLTREGIDDAWYAIKEILRNIEPPPPPINLPTQSSRFSKC